MTLYRRARRRWVAVFLAVYGAVAVTLLIVVCCMGLLSLALEIWGPR